MVMVFLPFSLTLSLSSSLRFCLYVSEKITISMSGGGVGVMAVRSGGIASIFYLLTD
jgi:hypothetical protein